MPLFFKLFFKRAALLGGALFFIQTWAADKLETPQDIVEKAYTLSLQKDRLQAVNLLVSAIKKESKKGATPKELLLALEEVSGVFYSDKAQQLYELALSLRMTDSVLAGQKLAEAGRLEPENQQILVEQIRLQLGSGDCEGAFRQTKRRLEINPYSEEIKLVCAQAAICSGQPLEYQQIRSSVDMKKNKHDVFWQTAEMENAHRLGAFAKGKEIAQAVQKTDPVYPESYYWNWKFEKEMKLSGERMGQKYLASCKSLSSRAFRQYLAEPRLCKRVGEVEAELKKTNGSGG